MEKLDRYKCVLKKIFPKHHLQDAGKCMEKKTILFGKTENIL